MSVWGTGGNAPRAEAFLDGLDHRISRQKDAHHHTSPYASHGFAYGTGCVLDHGKPPPRPAPIPCHPCALAYQDYAPNSHATPNPEGNDATRPEVSTHPFGSYGTPPVREYPPVHPFDYACRPRLRTRLTRGRRTWPRNPWSSSGRDPHPSLATHVCILTPARSTARFPGRFAPRGTLSYPTAAKAAAASSVVCLSPATLSARNH